MSATDRAAEMRIDAVGGRTLGGTDFAEMRPHLTDGYVVKGVLKPGTLAGIIGASGCGKTFFGTDLALHIAAGKPWRGRKVKGAPVVYAALEGAASAENRFVAARDHGGFPARTPLRLTPDSINLRDPDDVLALVRFVRLTAAAYEQKQCAAVFIDTLSRAMAGGDENGPEDMGALVKGADEVRIATGAAVILVHHWGKDGDRGARGHTCLKAALDTEIEIVKGADTKVATVTKQRDLPEGDQFAFRLDVVKLGDDEDGDVVTTCTVSEADSPAPTRKGPGGINQRKLLSALQEWRRQHAGADVISTIDMREIARGQGIKKKSAMQDALEKLVEHGWIAASVGGYRLQTEDKL